MSPGSIAPLAATWPLGRTLLHSMLALAWVALPALLAARWTRYPGQGAIGKSLAGVLSIVLVLGAYALFVRLVEQRVPLELASRGAGAECLAGSLMGAGVFTAVVAILAAAGAYRITGRHDATVVSSAMVGVMAGALFEEVLFRAIILRCLERWCGSPAALALSALLFGLMHLGGPSASLRDALAVAIEAGLLLGTAFMATRRLWLCTGMHFGWNLMQGAVFSVPVSGHPQTGLFVAQLSGASWLTGGQFGIESSALAVVLCVLLAAMLLEHARRSGQLVARPARRVRIRP